MANNFTPATVQMPLNVMDAHYDSFQKQVLPVLLKHGIGPLAMKSMGDHILLESNTVTPMECLHYAMNLPVAVVITGCDSVPILEQALNAARTFQPLNEARSLDSVSQDCSSRSAAADMKVTRPRITSTVRRIIPSGWVKKTVSSYEF